MSSPSARVDSAPQDPRAGASADRPPAQPIASRQWRMPVAVALGTIGVAGGTALGLWYLPFVAGVITGVVARRRHARRAAWACALIAVGPLAWGAVLAGRALGGDTVGTTGRTVAALAGLPPSAAVTFAVTLLIATLQTAAGAWLGRAVSPPRRS